MNQGPGFHYTPPPTVREYMLSDAFVRLIVGPVGSGKTTGSIMELLRRAAQQAPAPDDGIRYTRFALVRNTLKQLKDTVLKDVQQLLGPLAHYKVSESTLYVEFNDVKSEWLFIPLDNVEDQRRLLSTQLTGAYINEFVEVDLELVSALLGRIGRFPSASRGKPTWQGLIGDSNPSGEDNPWYERIVLDPPKQWDFWMQPSALVAKDPNEEEDPLYLEYADLRINPEAENAENLPDGYYERLLDGASLEWAEKYVFARWGRSLSGQAVFQSSYYAAFHEAESELVPVANRPLVVGLDFARHPAAVVTQVDGAGRLLVLAEVHRENCGIEVFFEEELYPLLTSDRLSGHLVVGVGDPSGVNRHETGEENVYDILKRLGFVAYPATTNRINPRLRAVESWLNQQRNGKAAALFDPFNCPDLLQAMRGRYRFKKKKTTGELDDVPDKARPWSDLADALQYACLGSGRNILGRVMRRQEGADLPPQKIPSKAAWT